MDAEKQVVGSLTDTQYWDGVWADRAVPYPLDPNQKGLNGYVARSYHRYFEAVFRSIGVKAGDMLCEAGGGGSIFLPYFRREFGLIAEGLDNSQEGCALSEAIARQCGIQTPVYCGDVFKPPENLLERYRVVVSFGLAEHFRPTATIISALMTLVQPSGYLITQVPNMHGAVGLLQRLVDPSVYSVHVPLSPSELAAAHRECDLRVLDARHLMTACFSVVNFSGRGSRIPARFGLRLASWLSKAIWIIEGLGLPPIPNGVTSPFVFVVAQKAARGRTGPVIEET
jgi:hypothetical protein